jgi:hypothetical protein
MAFANRHNIHKARMYTIEQVFHSQYFTKIGLQGSPKTGVQAYARTPVFGLLLFCDLLIVVKIER